MGHAILERVLLFGTRSADYIRASGHNGCIATEVTLQATTEAEYMTAPERFADSQIPLAPRAPSIHDPSATFENFSGVNFSGAPTGVDLGQCIKASTGESCIRHRRLSQ